MDEANKPPVKPLPSPVVTIADLLHGLPLTTEAARPVGMHYPDKKDGSRRSSSR